MDSEQVTQRKYCSLNSLSVNEPLYGSAPNTSYWLLLEYPHAFAAKAVEASRLPVPVKGYLASLTSMLPGLRVCLIKGRASTTSNPTLFLADAREGHIKLFKITLNNYQDILQLDIPGIFASGAASSSYLPEERLFLVCTNGKRDACCSKWGLALYHALEKHAGQAVWQTSHVGGHRFAPNLVCLPHGIYYGRVPLTAASEIFRDYKNGRLYLDFYRGRASYPGTAQAAEYFLRSESKEEQLDAITLENLIQVGLNQWEITFSASRSKKIYRLHIASELTDRFMYESCNTPTELKPVREFRLQQIVLSG